MPKPPILWSFRRCPYAMRARLAIQSSGRRVALREILLRDKPVRFLDTSPKGTVPVLDTGRQVIEESRDVMLWALSGSDPDGLLDMPSEGYNLIEQCDGPFKRALDHCKYANRHPALDPAVEREKALTFLRDLDQRLAAHGFLMGPRRTLADMAILPFVRQFAHIDRPLFDSHNLVSLTKWLDDFLASAAFAGIMVKYPPWQDGQDQVFFP